MCASEASYTSIYLHQHAGTHALRGAHIVLCGRIYTFARHYTPHMISRYLATSPRSRCLRWTCTLSPLAHTAKGSAPPRSSTCAAARLRVWCSGVQPWLSATFTSAPLCTRSRITLSWSCAGKPRLPYHIHRPRDKVTGRTRARAREFSVWYLLGSDDDGRAPRFQLSRIWQHATVEAAAARRNIPA